LQRDAWSGGLQACRYENAGADHVQDPFTRLHHHRRRGQPRLELRHCDNDVVDNQVVNLLLAGQQTATFTMTAFTELAPRKTRIFGTRGELEGDGVRIRRFDFLTEQTYTLTVESGGASQLQGHGGGDYALMDSFVAAVAEDDPGRILSGPDESLETHLMVFAAEQARREERVVRVEL